ncbi:hypothetical protein P2H44_07580 [Albimonas sp. CAU 1670]|uniref:hypothetical protein n=1 Tax=Albimonas sp. CAU 1670 TaxID=3032599 RepID=UPI0023DAD1C9|nr:hypothetical protein [Albimonas sp. CAU 1670]MDF2232413.1 hypothetical protein [Albimonas sp. CAU 1670]
MDQSAKLAIYQAQVQNARSLKTALRQVHRCVNDALRSNDQARISAFTKTYALLFCSWAEANFSKIIHTPYGFEIDEIEQIQRAKKKGIAAAWKKAVDLGLRHLDAKRGSFQPNTKKKLYDIIDLHVFDPSLFRNKLAHGQWSVALNQQNDAIEAERTSQIAAMDVVQISSWIRGHDLLAEAIEALIESPRKAFMRDWHQYVVKLEENIRAVERRTLQQHVQNLLNKDARTGARAKRHNTGHS